MNIVRFATVRTEAPDADQPVDIFRNPETFMTKLEAEGAIEEGRSLDIDNRPAREVRELQWDGWDTGVWRAWDPIQRCWFYILRLDVQVEVA